MYLLTKPRIVRTYRINSPPCDQSPARSTNNAVCIYTNRV